MGGPPQVIMPDDEAAVKINNLFQEYVTEQHITYIQSIGNPVFGERMIRTFREMLDKRIKPDEQWADLIYPVLLTYTNNLVHSTTEFRPNHAREESSEAMTNINMLMQEKHNRRHPELHVGNSVKQITK